MLSDAPFARVGRGRTSIFRGRSRDGLSLHAAQDRGAGRKAAAAFNCFAALASVVSSPPRMCFGTRKDSSWELFSLYSTVCS